MTLSIYQLKPRFQRLLSPFLRTLAGAGITPNQVTLAACALSVTYGIALAVAPHKRALLWGMPLLLLLRMALNAIDGMLANATASKTRLGALLNESCDQCSDVALYLPFALLPGLSSTLTVLVVVAGLLAEFSGVLVVTIGAPRGFEGPMGKSDRAFGFGLLSVLLATNAAAFWFKALLSTMLALSAWTVANRLRRGLQVSAPATP